MSYMVIVDAQFGPPDRVKLPVGVNQVKRTVSIPRRSNAVGVVVHDRRKLSHRVPWAIALSLPPAPSNRNSSAVRNSYPFHSPVNDTQS